MPKKFDDMVKAIKDSGKSEQDAYAIATAQWKKSHGGKAPQRESVVDEITRYLEEEGQPELFDADTMLHHVDLPKEIEMYLMRRGKRISDEITEYIMHQATQILVEKAKEMGYEGPGAPYADVEEIVDETEAYYELVTDMCRAFLEGMESSWPNPIVNV